MSVLGMTLASPTGSGGGGDQTDSHRGFTPATGAGDSEEAGNVETIQAELLFLLWIF